MCPIATGRSNLHGLKHEARIHSFSKESADHAGHYAFAEPPGPCNTDKPFLDFKKRNQFIDKGSFIDKVSVIHD